MTRKLKLNCLASQSGLGIEAALFYFPFHSPTYYVSRRRFAPRPAHLPRMLTPARSTSSTSSSWVATTGAECSICTLTA